MLLLLKPKKAVDTVEWIYTKAAYTILHMLILPIVCSLSVLVVIVFTETPFCESFLHVTW